MCSRGVLKQPLTECLGLFFPPVFPVLLKAEVLVLLERHSEAIEACSAVLALNVRPEKSLEVGRERVGNIFEGIKTSH